MEHVTKKDLVSVFLENGILIGPETTKNLTQQVTKELLNAISQKIDNKEFLLVHEELIQPILQKTLPEIDWKELDKYKVLAEKKDTNAYGNFLDQFLLKKTNLKEKRVKVITTFNEAPHKKVVQDFTDLFNYRYNFLRNILQGRPELVNPISIRRIKEKKTKEEVSLICMVTNKHTTKSNNLLFEVEDQTGSTHILVNRNKEELFSLAENIMLDETIGIRGINSENIIFANNILLPDIPFHELKKADEEAYAIFLSDTHVGSKQFLSKSFDKFLKWINGETGSEEQKTIAKKVKYLFIAGDLVDGVGIYPNQEEELELTDVTSQYQRFIDLLKKIPSEIEIILSPGNHDSVRVAEPQPIPHKEFAGPLYGMPNVTIISNPSMVNIHASSTFPGFNVLMYHGYSFDYFIANVNSIRLNGGYNRADLVMKYLLQNRHLAPTYTSSPLIPSKGDPLLIKQIPDIFITGHIHYCVVSSYKNVSLISGSCWQGLTSFQEKMGHTPEPARVPIINLKTRAMKILRF